jgi:hypothetical protein
LGPTACSMLTAPRPSAWSVPSAGKYRVTTRSNEGLRPLGRQSRGKDDSHCPAHGGAPGDAERKEEKKKQTICRVRKMRAGQSQVIETSAFFVRRLCLQGVVTVGRGVGTGVGTPVTTPSMGKCRSIIHRSERLARASPR